MEYNKIMIFRIIPILLLVAVAFFWSATPAPADETFTREQRSHIEQIVREYLLENPELIVEVLEELEKREKAEAKERSRDMLTANKSALFYSDGDFVFNPDGKILMVEFFDYQCGYCKQVLANVMQVVKEQKEVRIAFKEFPILGPVSVFASKASLAAKRQGKFLEFHTSVMAVRGRLSEDIVLAKARDVGLDMDRLKQDMESKEIQAVIDANLSLGSAMQIRGTPTLIIGDNLVPGAISYGRMVELIEETRENCTVC